MSAEKQATREEVIALMKRELPADHYIRVATRRGVPHRIGLYHKKFGVVTTRLLIYSAEEIAHDLDVAIAKVNEKAAALATQLAERKTRMAREREERAQRDARRRELAKAFVADALWLQPFAHVRDDGSIFCNFGDFTVDVVAASEPGMWQWNISMHHSAHTSEVRVRQVLAILSKVETTR